MSDVYDIIGRTYGRSRRADLRIVDELIRLLDLQVGATLCDVGAGCGNYSNALASRGFTVIAVEPSATMRGQAPAQQGVTWMEGAAESIPVADGGAAAVICTLAAHHFRDLRRAAREISRVCPEGPIIFFTYDPRRGQEQWLPSYFPEIVEKDLAIFPAIADFISIIGGEIARRADVTSFPLPRDLVDLILYAPWGVPETYLDPVFRANTSGFATAEPSRLNHQLKTLAEDLRTGRWDERFGQFRTAKQNDAGYCFVRFQH